MQQPPQPDSSSKALVWFIMGIVIIVVIVASIYLFLSKQTAIPQTQTTTTQTPAPVVQENLEDNLNNIDVDTTITSDFSSIDQDLQQL